MPKVKSSFVLVFIKDPNSRTYLEQIDREIDQFSVAGKLIAKPHLIVCTKQDWTMIEGELQKEISARYETGKVEPYDRINGVDLSPRPPSQLPKGEHGFITLVYRTIGIVAMDANNNNIIGARLGAAKHAKSN